MDRKEQRKEIYKQLTSAQNRRIANRVEREWMCAINEVEFTSIANIARRLKIITMQEYCNLNIDKPVVLVAGQRAFADLKGVR